MLTLCFVVLYFLLKAITAGGWSLGKLPLSALWSQLTGADGVSGLLPGCIEECFSPLIGSCKSPLSLSGPLCPESPGF